MEAGWGHTIRAFLKYNRKIEKIESLSALKNFLHLCQRLDVPIKRSKTVLSSRVIIICGINCIKKKEKKERRLQQDRIFKINTVV